MLWARQFRLYYNQLHSFIILPNIYQVPIICWEYSHQHRVVTKLWSLFSRNLHPLLSGEYAWDLGLFWARHGRFIFTYDLSLIKPVCFSRSRLHCCRNSGRHLEDWFLSLFALKSYLPKQGLALVIVFYCRSPDLPNF